MASPVLSLQPVSEGAKQRFLERGQAEDLPANIRRCWERVRSAVDPTHEAKPHVLEGGEVRDRADRLDRWLPLLPEALESVHRALSRRDHVVLFADRDAVVLHQSARAAISDAAREAGIVTGSVWDEGVKGTNAIGTALVEGQPMTVHGAAHFSRAFHNFTCYAALVHDLGGDRLGVIDATTIADRRAPDGWRAVATAAAQWERKMRTLAGPEDHLLRWSQLERIVGRFRGTTAVFGPRGTLRLGLDGEPRHGSQRDLAALWVPIERAIRDGQVSLQSAELELHLEPFHDPSGRLLEIIVHSERRPPQRSFHGAQRLPAADPLTALEGADPAQRAACHRARRLASTSLPIALLAETGTGKELLARAIHRCSPQREGPFVALNCAALPEGIVESELFGHAPGAFTGAALRGQEGWLAAADGGTLFLDEVADLPAHVQLTLLRFLEDGTYARIGERHSRQANVRIIAATSQDLRRRANEGDVRIDFFYRVCAASITLPPLRERVDRVELAQVLLSSMGGDEGRPGLRLSPAARRRVEDARWPGNIRQLKHALQVAMALTDADEISAEDLPTLDVNPLPFEAQAPEESSPLALDEVQEALGRHAGNVAAAARALGVARSTIYRLLRRHQLSVDQLLQESPEAPPDESSR